MRRSIWTGLATLVALCLVLTACSGQQTLEAFTNDAEQARAQEWIETMRRGDIEALTAKFDPSIASPQLPDIVAKMSKLVPPGAPTERKLVGVTRNSTAGETVANLTYQYRFGEKYFLINCATKEIADGSYTLVGMSVNPLESSIETQNAVTFSGKGPLHYLVLLLAIAFPVLTVFALFLCARERDLKRKWLWIVAILFGVTQLSLDWNSGEWEFALVHFMLFSSGFMKAPYGPLVLSVGLPAGAVAYLLRRRNSSAAPVSNPA